MKWFDRSWCTGQMTDTQVEFVRRDYAQHVAGIRRHHVHLGTLLDLDLHDGQVRDWESHASQFRWRALVGDLQRGYELATITYDGADVVGGTDDLARLRLRDAGVEVLYDEVDVDGDGRPIHRVLIWPEGEFWVSFERVVVEREPATAADRR